MSGVIRRLLPDTVFVIRGFGVYEVLLDIPYLEEPEVRESVERELEQLPCVARYKLEKHSLEEVVCEIMCSE